MLVARIASCITGREQVVPQTATCAPCQVALARAVVCALSLVAFLLTVAPVSARTMSTAALLASPAAQAYKTGKFAGALRGFKELEARYPDDVTIKRLKGMALYNLERYSAAVQTFRDVVALDPKNVAAQFWLGAALFKIGAVADSYAAFQRTVALAPKSPYGVQSAKFIAAIDKQTIGRKQFSVDLTGGVQYDDNVSLVNTNKVHAFRFFEQVDARYYVVRKPGWFASVLAGGYFGQHTAGGPDNFGNRARDFDLASGTVGFDVRHETSAFGIPVAPGLTYTYNLVDEDYDRFSDIHTLTASLEANPTPDAVVRLYHRFYWDFFARDGLDPVLFSRDGTRQATGIENYLYFDQKRHYVWGGYEYTTTWADGVNFDARAHKFSGGLSLTLMKDLILSASAQYVLTRYVNFAGTPKRRSAAQTYSVELARKFAQNLIVKLAYSYTFDDENITAFETVRNIATLSVTRQF